MRHLVASAGIVIVLAAAGCGGGGEDADGEKRLDLVIGSPVPLGGELSGYGPAGRKAARLAEAQIRKAIARSGADHTVKVVIADDQRSPGAAADVARGMVEADGATCIAGAWAAIDTVSIAESVSVPNRILQISPASTAAEITELDDDGLLDRTVPPDPLQGPSLADAIAEDLGGAEGRAVNIGARDDDYGNRMADSFNDAWRELGGEIDQEVIYDPDQLSYASVAAQITEGSPDAFVIIDFPETFAHLGPALEGTGGWDPSRTWSTAALASPDLPGDVGQTLVEGLRGTTPGAPDDAEPSLAFDTLYAAADPDDVQRQTFDAQAFDATILCYLAAVSAGSTDGEEMSDAVIDLTAPGGTEYSWRQLPEAIEALQNGEDIDYDGASGPIDMDENGDATAGVYDIYRFKGGGLEIIGETEVRTPDE